MPDFIPGINVGNAFKQVGSFVGLAPKGDYDVLDGVTNSNRAGQVQVNALPDVTSGRNLVGTPSVQSGGGGGGGSSSPVVTTGETATQAAARIAAQQAAAQRQAKINQYGITAGGYKTAAQTSLRDLGNTYEDSINQLVNDYTSGQTDINSKSAQNELNLRQSMANIIKGIQTGVRSGNVSLAGMNASDSGAAEALTRAYARVGNNQSAEANTQAATVSDQLATSQRDLNRKKEEGISTLDRNRATELDRVRNDFGTKIDQLLADASSNGVSGVADRGIVDQVLNEALGRLTGLTQQRDQRLSSVQAFTPQQIAEEAARLQALGQTGNAFQVADPTVQMGGANSPVSNGGLPIYVKGREDALVANPFKKDTRLVTA